MIAQPPAVLLADLRVRAGARLLAAGDLEVAAGERVALVGPSGSGKSTLARAITASLPADLTWTGRLEVAGSPLRPDGRRMSPAALVQQDTQAALHPLVPIGRQLGLPWRDLTRPEARARVLDLADRVGLGADLLERLPGELSGGQRQRACLALALAADAPLLVADEPTSALDPITQCQVLDTLASLPAAILLITHDAAVAAHLCDRAVVLPATPPEARSGQVA